MRSVALSVKVIILAVIVLIMSVVVLPKSVSAFLGDGEGTLSDPYIITDCSELQDMSSDVVAHYELANDIDCSGGPFQPVGDNGSPFMGSLNGNGYTISDLSIAIASDNAGLFGATYEAEIDNLYLDGVDMDADDRQNVGALVGNAGYTTITHVHATDVDIVVDEGTNVGGLVGQLGGSSINRSSATNLSLHGSNDSTNVGGLVGYMVGPSAINNAFSNGQVSGNTVVGGLIGRIGAGPTVLTDSYSAAIVTGDTQLDDFVAVGMAVDNSGLYTASGLNLGEAVEDWDFDDIWYVRPDDYPALRPTALPAMLCEEVLVTDTTLEAACSTNRPLDGNPSWQLQYRAPGFTDWIDLDSQSGASFDVTLTDLLPGTEYELRFRFNDNIGVGPWGKVTGTTTGSSDIDEDSISNIEEASGPNDGDSNHDGEPDAEQTNVATLISPVTGEYVTLEVEDECSITRFVVSPTSDFEIKDTGYQYPNGLMDFNLACDEVGDTVRIRHLYHNVEFPHFELRKYNSNTQEYARVDGAAIEAHESDERNYVEAEYDVVDGGELDEDGEANGEITDPAGLATTDELLAETGQNETILMLTGWTLLTVGIAALRAYNVHLSSPKLPRHR